MNRQEVSFLVLCSTIIWLASLSACTTSERATPSPLLPPSKTPVVTSSDTYSEPALSPEIPQPDHLSADVQIPDSTTASEPEAGCAAVQHLAVDSPEVQQIIEEFVRNAREQQPEEYMGLAVLHRIDSLGEWTVIQGSVSGEGKDVITVHQTSQGYQLAGRYLITAPLTSFDDPENLVPHYFLDKLPEAPPELFTCLDQSWLLGQAADASAQTVYQIAYVGTEDFTQTGVTEIHTLTSDGSNNTVILHEPLMVMDLTPSPDGERLTFWGCPGNLTAYCLTGEDPDIWVMNWDGTDLVNLTADSPQADRHPDWSPDGTQIVFESERSGMPQIYRMDAGGNQVQLLTVDDQAGHWPSWSPEGQWIAYLCGPQDDMGICIISTEGELSGERIPGADPVWAPASEAEEARLAFTCFVEGIGDICTVRPDGSEMTNLTRSPAEEHSPAWSPDGEWLAFVSDQEDDQDVYKICTACTGESGLIRLTDEPRPAGRPAWSPDGRQVAYVAGGDLMRVNADGSSASWLTSGIFYTPVWRPSPPISQKDHTAPSAQEIDTFAPPRAVEMAETRVDGSQWTTFLPQEWQPRAGHSGETSFHDAPSIVSILPARDGTLWFASMGGVMSTGTGSRSRRLSLETGFMASPTGWRTGKPAYWKFR